ncbi:MAG: M20/M25/M40 family metallo-hydrolase [Clostridiales bacterium]|nr:M20/M25/M40 family metallo-hydrolase [Clostridiales bacterium]
MDAWAFLQELMRIPHRGSTTPEEARAARWLKEKLEAMGAEVEVIPFRAPSDTLYRGPALVALLMALALALSALWPALRWGGLLLCLVLLSLLVGELQGSLTWDLDRILPKGGSQNVLARFGKGSPAFILMAHYDTQKGSWLFHPRLKKGLRPLFLGVYLLFFAAPLLLLWGEPWALTAEAFLLLTAGLSFLQAAFTGRPVPGANDNGSGTALALSLAETLKDEGPGPFWVVLTGAEEVGERGAKAFLRQFAEELSEKPPLINLDNLGAGGMRLLEREGALWPLRYPRSLRRLAQMVAEEAGVSLRPLPSLLLPTDGLPFLAQKWPALTFCATLPSGEIPHYHHESDILEHVDGELLRREETFLLALLRRLGRG